MYIHRGLLLVFLVIFIFSPTILEWISNNQSAWYRPFIVWGCVIYLAYNSQRKAWRKDSHV
jgi:uncharacterized membrane protein